MSYESRVKRVVQYFVLTGVVFCHTNSSKKGCAVFCCNGCSIMIRISSEKGCAVFCVNGCGILLYEFE